MQTTSCRTTLDDFPWVDGGTIERAAEHFLESEYPVAVVEEQAAEDFMRETGELRPEKIERLAGCFERGHINRRAAVDLGAPDPSRTT